MNSLIVRRMRCRPGRPALLATMAALVMSVSSTTSLHAQNEDEIAEPEIVSLETRDNVRLQCRWYQGGAGKESIPIIMVHGWDGNMDEYDHLAKAMQKQGHSVMAINMRGHGGSMTVRGSDMEIDRDKMNKAQIAAMVNDIDAVRKWLVEKNDEGKVNIDMLTIVAAEEMCIIAAQFALTDWSFQPLGGRRQGQYVKALVFLSPTRSFKGLTLNTLIRDPLFSGQGASPFSVLVAAGKGARRPYQDAERIHGTMERTRPKIEPEGENAAERRQDMLNRKDLYMEAFDGVEYQGTALVHPQAPLDMPNKIGGFLYYRLTAKSELFPWALQNRD